MKNPILLSNGTTIDTSIQVVKINQIIQMEGYNFDKYVVYDITKNEWGIKYELINLRTKEYRTTDVVRPLNEKFGIGYYYDSENPKFMDAIEVMLLRQEAEKQMKEQKEALQREKIQAEEDKKIGRERLEKLMPENTQAMIVAELKKDKSDLMTDYFASSIERSVILGFSTHKRDLFSEMRKHAANFEETAHLAEYNPEYEHREKYSMGAGYYLGEDYYQGWIIRKISMYSREGMINNYAQTASNEENIRITKPKTTTNSEIQTLTETGNFIVVDYSEKSIAVFGDTKPIKDQLSELGGRFNRYLTIEGEKRAGWIFKKSKEQEVRTLLNL